MSLGNTGLDSFSGHRWETRQQVRPEGGCCGLRDAIDNAVEELLPLLVARSVFPLAVAVQ